MKSAKILIPVVIGLFILSTFMRSTFVGAASSPNDKPDITGPATGIVDIESVYGQSGLKSKLEGDLQSLKTQLEQKLELRNNNGLLSPDEFKQLADLTAKPSPTADDTKKIQELNKAEADREQDLTTLQQKQGATDAEKDRLKALTAQMAKAAEVWKAEKDADEESFRDKQIEMKKQAIQQIETEVTAVAKQKGLTLVLNKTNGDMVFVAYSSNDITDAVVQRMNKK
jgi:Skp family chaperone for outer membrane proteins